MGLLFMFVVGAALGWLAAIVARIESPRGVVLDIAAGIGGALLTGLVIGPFLGGPSLLGGQYQVEALLLSLAGSLAVVALFSFVYRRQLH